MLLQLSLLLNVLFILAGGLVCYKKRATIKTRISKYFASSRVSEKDLKNFNIEPYEINNDTIQVSGGGRALQVLFLGNSITLTGVTAEEPDKTRRGCCSTSIEKDYVHIVLNRLAHDTAQNIDYSILNIAEFERSFSTTPFDFAQLEACSVKNPDYLIVQIGENVAADDIANYGEKFEEQYIELLSHFPTAKRIICIPFWPDRRKAKYITNVALKTKSHLVDLSHLGASVVVKIGDYFDPLNLAESQKNYKQPGVGVHPGDYGMQSIADAIYAAIGAE